MHTGGIILECAMFLNEGVFEPDLVHESETVICKERKKSKMRLYRWITLGIF